MNQNRPEIPIQPVEQPILCSPYEEPNTHWVYDTRTGEAVKQPGHREAGYWYKTGRTDCQTYMKPLKIREIRENPRFRRKAIQNHSKSHKAHESQLRPLTPKSAILTTTPFA